MEDGLDIRQTIREWPTGPIYVEESRPLKGKVGSVVVIFDPDLADKDGKEDFPWLQHARRRGDGRARYFAVPVRWFHADLPSLTCL
jgi:hypothetical protein